MDLWPITIIAAMLFVAYANGANDNFKGVATLFGSGATDYRKALWWATITTLTGSVAAFFLAAKLVSIFQGNGLLPAHLTQSEPFIAAVVLGAALTVMVATKLGMPISTTHSLTGALVGSGFVAVGLDIGLPTLLGSFFLPLLVSPLLAMALASWGYPLLVRALQFPGLGRDSCICVGGQPMTQAATASGVTIYESTPGLRVIVESQSVCAAPQAGTLLGISGPQLLDAGHFISAGAVSFARGLNDTPKIVALGLVASSMHLYWAIGLVAIVMAAGGLLNAKNVAETVSRRITAMNPDQGLTANLVTSFLVIGASKWGLPVSTTQISCGALFGIGLANDQAHWRVIRTILLAWLVTLPTAALLSAGCYCLFKSV
jgi:PiT family inorganic phosphate transporter